MAPREVSLKALRLTNESRRERHACCLPWISYVKLVSHYGVMYPGDRIITRERERESLVKFLVRLFFVPLKLTFQLDDGISVSWGAFAFFNSLSFLRGVHRGFLPSFLLLPCLCGLFFSNSSSSSPTRTTWLSLELHRTHT